MVNKGVRLTVIVLSILVLAIYFGFMYMMGTAGQ